MKKLIRFLIKWIPVFMVLLLCGTPVLAMNQIHDKEELGHNGEYDNNMVLAAEQEGIEGFVTRLFNTCLGREPDSGGLEHWSGELRKNILTGISVAEFFFNSEEFTAKKVNDSGFLDLLYTTLMDRKADESGKAYWQKYLDTGSSRDGVLRAFLNSTEFGNICTRYGITTGTAQPKTNRDHNLNLTAFVYRLYTEVLQRNADEDGLNYWTGKMIHEGWTAIQAAEQFVFSEEFDKQNLGDGCYLDVLYAAFMGRSADTNGSGYWLSEMSSGKNRKEIFNSFALSKEFADICAQYGVLVGTAIQTGIPKPKDPEPTPAPTPAPQPTPAPIPETGKLSYYAEYPMVPDYKSVDTAATGGLVREGNEYAYYNYDSSTRDEKGYIAALAQSGFTSKGTMNISAFSASFKFYGKGDIYVAFGSTRSGFFVRVVERKVDLMSANDLRTLFALFNR